MRYQGIFWILLALLAAPCRANLLQYVDDLPTCGVTCILGELPSSACKVATNDTCICTDTNLHSAVQACVLLSCTTEEALTIERVQSEACGISYRSRRKDLWGFIAVEAFSLLCICTRILSHWSIGRSYGIDDYVVLAVLVLFLAFTVIGQYARLTAFGVDIWTVDNDTISRALQLFYIDESIYLAVLALCKIVILGFFLRVFPHKRFRLAVYGTVGFVALSTLVLIFLQIFQCMPVRYNWEGWKGNFGDYKCLNVNLLTYIAATMTILQDVVILVLPLPLLVHLNTNWRKRINVIIMFSLGIFILITSCIRLRYIVVFARSLNPTWDYTDTLIWTALEVNVSVIVVSLPAIRALLAVNLPQLFGSTSSSGSGTYNLSKTKSSSKKQAKAHGSKFSSVFSSRRADEDDDDAESQLELGDRMQGSMQTEIAVDHDGPDSRSRDSTGSQQRDGIYVKKILVWQEEGPDKSGG